MTSMAVSYMRPRKIFQRMKPRIEHPNLIEVQKTSYDNFLQINTDPLKRENDSGLQAAFISVFPIKDYSEMVSLEFVSYSLDDPKYTVDECRQRGMSYASPIRVIIRLVIWEIVEGSEEKTIKEVKEQEVFFGEIPLMTFNGTFIINGTERVVVSQLHRSAGVFFDHDKGKGSGGGKMLFTGRVIPYRGSWLDFEFDSKDILYVRIDRRRKLQATILLKALGYSDADLLSHFYDKREVKIESGRKIRYALDFAKLRGQRISFDIVDKKTGKVIVEKGRRITLGTIRNLEKNKIKDQSLDIEYILGHVLAADAVNASGEVVVPTNTALEQEHVDEIVEAGIKKLSLLITDNDAIDNSLRATLLSDKVQTKEEALVEIYKKVRPGDPPTVEGAENLFQNLFFNEERYDLGVVGRIKLNERLGVDESLSQKTLTHRDILATVGVLLRLKVGRGVIDDIDHLGNRRVRAVGELLENQYRIGLLRIERAIRDRLQLQDIDTMLPHDVINNKPASAVVKEFFGSSQLSQFMDQTNPLSEITHKRRLSALGPGGLSRDRAGFEVRDVHRTHYGRICPVETPEGPNIGLISSLAAYARVNEYGFLETPYQQLGEKDSAKENKVRYYSASEETAGHIIAQASDVIRDEYKDEFITVRRDGESETVIGKEADLADVASNQLVSVAANLIPFLQNDDANRALMGSNMMRQAVPLVKTRAPLIGTGMERLVARDSGASVVATREGVVVSVDAERIVVKVDGKTKASEQGEVGEDVDIYAIKKYRRSNLDTCINQKPIVKVGERVKKGDVVADGFGIELGELALGQNVRVAFMPWNGYNFEDSILISERVVKEDLYTSVHIQELECISRDTKLGQEEITCDIPNVSEEALVNLDSSGVIRIGAEVNADEILVGKITPKGETQLTPEERLLRAIFGEKAGDVRDSSLRVPPGVSGVVIGCKIFSRVGADRDERSIEIEKSETARLYKDEEVKISIIKESALRKIIQITKNTKFAKDIVDSKGSIIISAGSLVDKDVLEGLKYKYWSSLVVKGAEENNLLKDVLKGLGEKVAQIKSITEVQLNKITKGDELPPGVIKMVKIYIAIKRKLRVGDKMAGRHGNKGVISRILPEEDMPFTEDGRPVDVVLNPLGVPSRMNVGQILEAHIGWAAHNLGRQLNEMIENNFNRKEIEDDCLKIWGAGEEKESVKEFFTTCSDDELREFVKKYKEGVYIDNPVFDGATEGEIQDMLVHSGLNADGKVELYDGLSGDKFHTRVTVGIMYVMKLHHLVDEKIHARSIGPYSLITQQPLGGKAQFGGQRLGEMEVWAMEAYGAAHTLQEMLTVKSDDVLGRTRMYESIVKGTNITTPGLPESFNVLIKELQSLGLDIELFKQANGRQQQLFDNIQSDS
jgi:DNA-directed RNA polymerase subunit beta